MMTADTALRLQAAQEHLALAGEELAAINGGMDKSAASETAGLRVGLAVIALGPAVASIPAGLLMPVVTEPAAAPAAAGGSVEWAA